eukprot:scaffold684_cov345-Pavlova_lutheri.AAC.10
MADRVPEPIRHQCTCLFGQSGLQAENGGDAVVARGRHLLLVLVPRAGWELEGFPSSHIRSDLP